MNSKILELKKITKTFLGGKIIANDKVSLDFKKGEVHALVGENGSGKSTLMNILFGLYKQDSGTIKINGQVVDMFLSGAASKHKIGMVHQHFHLVDNFTVLDNILIGQENPEEDQNKIEKLKKRAELKNTEYKVIWTGLDKNIKSLIKQALKIKENRRNLIGDNISLENNVHDMRQLLKRDISEAKFNSLEMKIEKALEKISDNRKEIRNLKREYTILVKTNGIEKHLKIIKDAVLSKKEYLGYKLTSITLINKRRALDRFKAIAKTYNINLDPRATIRRLPVGQRQMVEIMKVLWQDKNIIVFDEPTATLSVKEIDALMASIKQLQKQGKTIIFISHKLKEVKEIADRVTVLRKGVMMGTFDNTPSLSIPKISKLMVGRSINFKYAARKTSKDKILKVDDLSFITSTGFKALNKVSFDVKEGEIFGLAGIEGNGQEEVFNILAGLLEPAGGNVTFKDKEWVKGGQTVMSTSERNKIFSHSPIDRSMHGMVPDKSIKFNSILTSFESPKYSKLYKVKFGYNKTDKEKYAVLKDQKATISKFLLNNPGDSKESIVAKKNLASVTRKLDKLVKSNNGKNWIMDLSSTEDWTSKIVKTLKVEGAFDSNNPIRNLSGGNQQKFVFGRELLKDHKLLLAGHPTRGLDVSAIDNIYKKMIANSKGKATILYSLELNELMAVCDRMAIFYKGKIIDIINPRRYTLEDVSKLLIGVKK